MVSNNLDNQNIKDLKEKASRISLDTGACGYSRLKKAELIEWIRRNGPTPDPQFLDLDTPTPVSITNRRTHYCWIKDMSRLLSEQTSNHEHKVHFCLRCLNPFWCEETLRKHHEHCKTKESVKVVYPPKDENGDPAFLKFEHIQRSMRVPFVIYVDLEAFTEPIIHMEEPNPNQSYTRPYQKHTPSSFCYYILCFDGNVYSKKPVIVTKENEDDDIAQILVNSLEKEIKDIYYTIKIVVGDLSWQRT